MRTTEQRKQNDLAHPACTLYFNPMSTVYQTHQYAIRADLKNFKSESSKKMQKIQKTKVQTTSNTCDRFESAIVYLILVLFFMLVILFIHYMITKASHPILIGAELARV